jgi:hypothetical protein
LSFYGIDDPNIETAISIKNSLHNIMRMTKQQLQQNISNSQETVDVLRQHTVFKNKTIEDLRICLVLYSSIVPVLLN